MQDKLASYGCWLIELNGEALAGLEALAEAARTFFRVGSHEKLRYRTSVGEGYRPFATEYTDIPAQPDLVEVFACSQARSKIRASLPAGEGLTLYEMLLGAHPHFALLADEIATALLRAIGIELESDFEFDFPKWARLQVNFGVNFRSDSDLLNVQHEDRNFLTIAFATAPGLELVAGGERLDVWISQRPMLVVLAGGIMSTATRGAVPTGFHQVRRRGDVNERLAILYFADAAPSALVRINPSHSQEEFFRWITDGWLSSGVAPVQTSATTEGAQ